MRPKIYSMAFTAGSILFQESITIAIEYRKCQNDWNMTKQMVYTRNMLSSVKSSSSIRVYREIQQRLALLTENQLELLIEGTINEQKCMIWLAICKRYAFIADFAREVLNEKVQLFEATITQEEYHTFFHKKASWHEELDALKESTQQKVRTVLFRMLKEIGFLTEDSIISTILLTDNVIKVIAEDNPEMLNIYPY